MTLEEIGHIAPIVSATAITISATVAGIVFLYTRRANRRRATLDMVMKTFLDEGGRTRYDAFKKLTRKHVDPDDLFNMASLANRTNDNGADFDAVMYQLNDYELVSLGIRRGVFDEAFYKLWFHKQFTKDFEKVSGLIDAIQAGSPSTYCEFKRLYQRWMKKRHPVTHPGRFVKAWWALWGKDHKLRAVITNGS